MTESSDISVVLATYNGARFLHAQLVSIATQTLAPAEVLLFDDGSTPAQLAAIRSIVADFPGVVLVPGKNVGITANFARAIAAASQPCVALADQDDIWTPDHLAALRAGLGTADLVYGDMLFMDAEGRVSDERFSDRIGTIGMTSDDPGMFDALLHNSIVWGAAALFRRDLVAGRTIPDTRRYHDWWLTMLALTRRGVRYVDRVIVHHRIHDANGSHHRETRGLRGLLGGARREHRARQAAHALGWLEALDYGQLPLNLRQRRALDDATGYARSLLADDRRWWRTIYALRHRRVMVTDGLPLRQVAVALSKLL